MGALPGTGAKGAGTPLNMGNPGTTSGCWAKFGAVMGAETGGGICEPEVDAPGVEEEVCTSRAVAGGKAGSSVGSAGAPRL